MGRRAASATASEPTSYIALAPHHGSPASAMEPAGQDLWAPFGARVSTVPLRSRSNVSRFWIMLLLSSGAFEHGMIEAS